MQSEDFRPGLLVTIAGEPGVWRVAMYHDNRAAGLGEAVGLTRVSDDTTLELADDEFARLSPTAPDTHPRWHETFEEMFVQTDPNDDQEQDR